MAHTMVESLLVTNFKPFELIPFVSLKEMHLANCVSSIGKLCGNEMLIGCKRLLTEFGKWKLREINPVMSVSSMIGTFRLYVIEEVRKEETLFCPATCFNTESGTNAVGDCSLFIKVTFGIVISDSRFITSTPSI